jgi:hypothetical protein
MSADRAVQVICFPQNKVSCRGRGALRAANKGACCRLAIISARIALVPPA